MINVTVANAGLQLNQLMNSQISPQNTEMNSMEQAMASTAFLSPKNVINP